FVGARRMLNRAHLPVGLEKDLHPAPKLGLAGAGPVEKRRPPVGRVLLDGFQEQGLDVVRVWVHGASLSVSPRKCAGTAREMSQEKVRLRLAGARRPTGRGARPGQTSIADRPGPVTSPAPGPLPPPRAPRTA